MVRKFEKRARKAFTIVELVIVIAVIAILAAVLIPTFVYVVDKARVSADTQTVRNLNTALTIDEAMNGKSETMTEALAITEENGYSVDKLTPTSTGNLIVWDAETNRFVLMNAESKEILYSESVPTIGVNLWKITDDASEIASGEFSYYLKEGAISGSIQAKSGIDVGNNTAIETINYTGSVEQTVVFRTNGGELTVNNGKAIVSHYGVATTVNIEEVAGSSYHEYGTVQGNINLTKGRLVVENTGDVVALLIKADNAADIAVTYNGAAKIGTIAATKEGILSGANITVPGTTEKVETPVTEMSDFAGGFGTKSSPYLIETAKQFNRIKNFESEMRQSAGLQKAYYFKLINDIDLREETYDTAYVCEMFVGGLDGDGHKIYANDNLNYLFAKSGNATYSDFELVLSDRLVFVYKPGENYECDTIVFDGVDYSSITGATYSIGHNQSLYITYNVICKLPDGKYFSWGGHFTVENCTVDLNLAVNTSGNADASAAVFFGAYVWQRTLPTSVTVKNCTFNGTFRGPYVALVLNNGQGDIGLLNLSGIANNGILLGTIDAHLVAGQRPNATEEKTKFYDSIVNAGTGSINKITATGLAVSVNEENQVQIDRETAKDAEKYVIQLYGTRRAFDSMGQSPFSNYNYSIKFIITDLPDSDQMITDIKMGIIVDKQTAIEEYGVHLEGAVWNAAVEEDVTYAIVEQDGALYYVFNFDGLTEKTGLTYQMNVTNPKVSLEAYKEGYIFGSVSTD